MFGSRFMPCPECGASVDRITDPGHVCAEGSRVDFLMLGLRDEVGALENGIRGYLGTPAGRFEAWLAARQVRAAG